MAEQREHAWLRLAILLAACLSLAGCSPGCRRTPWVGDQAPDVELVIPQGGTDTLSELTAGRWTVLNFWISNCEPCRASMPKLERSWRAHSAEDLLVVGINSHDDAPTVLEFCDRMEISYPVFLDPQGVAQRAYLVRSVPTSFFLDPQGEIVEVLEDAAGEDDVRRHLARRRPAP